MLVERRRVEIDGDYRAWVDVALRRAPVEQAALTFDVALRSREIDLPHQDPADRFLAATALAYDLVLVTVDEHLTAADWLPTLSE